MYTCYCNWEPVNDIVLNEIHIFEPVMANEMKSANKMQLYSLKYIYKLDRACSTTHCILAYKKRVLNWSPTSLIQLFINMTWCWCLLVKIIQMFINIRKEVWWLELGWLEWKDMLLKCQASVSLAYHDVLEPCFLFASSFSCLTAYHWHPFASQRLLHYGLAACIFYTWLT